MLGTCHTVPSVEEEKGWHWAAARMVLRSWSLLLSSFLGSAPKSEVDAHLERWLVSWRVARRSDQSGSVGGRPYERPEMSNPLKLKHLEWQGRGNPSESVYGEAVNAMRSLPGSVPGSPSTPTPKTVLPVVALLGREKEQQPATSAGEAGPCVLAPPLRSGMLCCRLDPTDAARRVGAAYPGAREGPDSSDPRWQSGDKTGPGHARGKLGVENRMAGVRRVPESLWAGCAIWTRSCPCEILQDTAQSHGKLGEKLCLCPLFPPFFFFLPFFLFSSDICSFFPEKRFPARTYYFFFSPQ